MNSVAEVDAVLRACPVSPTTAPDVAERARLVQRRHELEKAEQAVTAAEAVKRERENWPFIVNVPDGVDAPCMSTRDGRHNIFGELLGGRFVIRMPDLSYLKALCSKDDRWYHANPEWWHTLAQIQLW